MKRLSSWVSIAWRESIERRIGMLSLGARLSVFVTLALVPLLLLLVSEAIEDRAVALAAARNSALQLATLGAAEQAEVFDAAREALLVLRRMEVVADPRSPACHAALHQLGEDHPQFTGFGIVEPDGLLRCHSRGTDVLAFWDPNLLAAVMASDATSILLSKFHFGAVTHRPTIMVAMPLTAATNGRPLGMIFASIDLRSLARIAARMAIAGQRSVTVIDPRDGTPLMPDPEPDQIIGRTFPDDPLVEAMRRVPDGGAFEGSTFGAEPGIFAFAPVPGLPTPSPMVVVGLPRHIVFGNLDARLGILLTVTVLTTLASLSLAMVIGRSSLKRTIGKLLDTAGRLGRGDLTARALLNPWQAPEFRTLAASLNDMAASVAAAQARLTESEAELRLLADNSADVIIKLDPQFKRIYTSPSVRDILGYEPSELIGAQPPVLLHPEDYDRVQAMFRTLMTETDRMTDVHRLRHRDGRWIWFEASHRRLYDKSTGEIFGLLGALRDISLRKAIEDELSRANARLQAWALQDGLTGLANRRSFDEILDRECRRAAREGRPLGLAMVDVDNFKIYNDIYGHQRGDDCLCAVARAISQALERPGDMAARYGGEEFAVILPDTDAFGTVKVAERIRNAVLALGLEHAGQSGGVVTISAGCANRCDASAPEGPRAMIEAADRNLYAAKTAGRNRVLPHWEPECHAVQARGLDIGASAS